MKKNSFFISNLSTKLLLVLLATNLGCSTFAGVDLNPLGSNSKKTTAANEIKDKALKSVKKQQAEVLVDDKKARAKEALNEEAAKREKKGKKNHKATVSDDNKVKFKTVTDQTVNRKPLYEDPYNGKVQVQDIKEPSYGEKVRNYRKNLLNFQNVVKPNGNKASSDGEQKIEKFDLEKHREESEKLYQQIKEFVQRSDELGVRAEDFDDYIKKYMNSCCKCMKVVSRNEFEELAKKPRILKLYRGISGEWFNRFLKGEVSMGKSGCFEGEFSDDENMNSFGYCLYTTVRKDEAQNYAKSNFFNVDFTLRQKNKKTGMSWVCNEISTDEGGVADILFDKNKFKWIDDDELEDIIITMKYLHPETFGLVESFDKRIPDNLYNSFQYGIFKKAFKKTFGFDCEEVAYRINPNYRKLKGDELENFTQLVDQVFKYSQYRGLTEKFNENFDELMRKNKTKAHYVNKYFKVLGERGLLAKFLGYDAVSMYYFRFSKKENFTSYDEDDTDEKYLRHVNVVNPESVVICGDGAFNKKPPVTFDELINYLHNDVKKR